MLTDHSEYIDSNIFQEMIELEKNYPVSISMKTFSEKRFLGADLITLSILFVLSGITGGILSGIGADIWKQIKKLLKKIAKEKKTTKIPHEKLVQFQLPFNSKTILLQCRLESNEDFQKLNGFLENIPTKVMSIHNLINSKEPLYRRFSSIKYEFEKDGTWRELSTEGE